MGTGAKSTEEERGRNQALPFLSPNKGGLTMDTQKQLNRSSLFRLKTEEKSTAYANYNHAGERLERVGIELREAELGSQAFEFVAKGKLQETLGEISDREREIGLAFARYAVYGRTD
jgi:hypothetical protein